MQTERHFLLLKSILFYFQIIAGFMEFSLFFSKDGGKDILVH